MTEREMARLDYILCESYIPKGRALKRYNYCSRTKAARKRHEKIHRDDAIAWIDGAIYTASVVHLWDEWPGITGYGIFTKDGKPTTHEEAEKSAWRIGAIHGDKCPFDIESDAQTDAH